MPGSTSRRQRQEMCQAEGLSIKESFHPSYPFAVHWDGKLLSDVTGQNEVDRLSILISGGGEEQLISVPKLLNATGKALADAVKIAIKFWNLAGNIIGISFDIQPLTLE